jgi:hypothetical protein
MKKFLYFLQIFLLFILFGCSETKDDVISLKRIDEKTIPKQTINEVCLIKQNDNYSCATTSLAMIISEYKGLHEKPLDKDIVWKYSESSISTIRTLGNDVEGLYKICNKYGFRYEFIQHLTNKEVEYLLSKHIYMVAFISINENQTHAITITGYDRTNKHFYINNTNGQKGSISYSDFDKCWSALLSHPRIVSERGALVVFPNEVRINIKGLRS